MLKEVFSFFTSNIAILISVIGIVISILSYLNSRKKVQFDIQSFKREHYVAVEKLNELMNIAREIKNTDPVISQAYIKEDIVLLNKFLEFYLSQEDKLIKADYTIVSQISTVRSTVSDLEKSLALTISNPTKETFIYKLQTTSYKKLYLVFYILCYPFDDNHQEHKKYGINHREFFLSVYEKFENLS